VPDGHRSRRLLSRAGGGGSAEPCRYGWRYVTRELPDGGQTIEQAPLTLEDVLHPRQNGRVTDGWRHERRRYLADMLAAQLAGDPPAVVLSDVLVVWDVPDRRPHGPDIAIVPGVRERKAWRRFDVAAEGVRPALIIALTAPATADLDRSRRGRSPRRSGRPAARLTGNRPASPRGSERALTWRCRTGDQRGAIPYANWR
jgi:hypothetical protein